MDGSRLLGRRTEYTEVSEGGMCGDRACKAEGLPLGSWVGWGGCFFRPEGSPRRDDCQAAEGTLGLELGPGKIPLPTVTEMAGARGETGSAPGREGQWGVEERRGGWRDSKNIYRARLETAQGQGLH